MKHAHRSRRRVGAFTLIELLLVMAILIMLAVLVVPRFIGRLGKEKIRATGVDIAQIEGTLDTFEVDCGRLPTTEEGLKALLEQPANADGWQGPYLKRGVPKDPWGAPYIYRCPGQHNTNGYDLFSCGPDGQEGTADDIDNWTQR